MSHQKTLRILVVDDHPDTVVLMARILASRGHRVERACTIADARTAAATHQFDVLITDGCLPDGNGIDLMRELNAQHGTAGILVSGSIDHRKEVVSEGFKFLAKPVNLQSLLDALQPIAAN